NISGIDFFLSPWVYIDNNLSFIVDPGPRSTIKNLKKKLNHLNISENDLDFILLTHIHMDHAGGTGELLKSFSKAKVVCHPRGIKHLINPEELWKGSKKVLGNIAMQYGEITPIPPDRILFQENIFDNKIRAIETLGHSPHHLSFLFQKYLFVGEAAGVNHPLPDMIYIRPATPPIFNFNVSMATLDSLIALKLSDYMICYAHHGIRDNAELMLMLAKEQLILWTNIIKDNIKERENSDFIQQIIQELKVKDKYFANIRFLDEKVRKREEFFFSNSIKGISQYLYNST
ncbi:MAG: MBL fold metallo-hydrolase, partial [Candidatus Hodarchaeota archaeon]